ncbi:TPA: hypothetical protein N2D99_002161 [Clostridium botulinum]|nr:hypothetical protein [Clostridium botulinum]
MLLVKAVVHGESQNIIISEETCDMVKYITENGKVNTTNKSNITDVEVIKNLNSIEIMSVVSLIKLNEGLRVQEKKVSSMISKYLDINNALTIKDIEPLLTNRGYKNIYMLMRKGIITTENGAIPEILYVHDLKNKSKYEFNINEKRKLAEALNYNYTNLDELTFSAKIKELFGQTKCNNSKENTKKNHEKNEVEEIVNQGMVVVEDLASVIKNLITNINK